MGGNVKERETSGRRSSVNDLESACRTSSGGCSRRMVMSETFRENELLFKILGRDAPQGINAVRPLRGRVPGSDDEPFHGFWSRSVRIEAMTSRPLSLRWPCVVSQQSEELAAHYLSTRTNQSRRVAGYQRPVTLPFRLNPPSPAQSISSSAPSPQNERGFRRGDAPI